jgi:hypothetical protein
MLDNIQHIQQFECLIELIISPLKTQGYESSDGNPKIILGIFNFDPGWQQEDWIEIQNFSLTKVKPCNLKAKVVERKKFIKCQNNVNEAILGIEIVLEPEDRDFIVEESERFDTNLSRRENLE